mgnify:CR=1 FL=1
MRIITKPILTSILFLIISNFLSCRERSSSGEVNKAAKIDQIEVDLVNKSVLKASEIFDEFELLKLETSDSFYIDRINKVVLEGSRIYLKCNSKILVYDLKGIPIYAVDAIGEGPSEYPTLSDFLIDRESQTLEIMSAKGKVARYSLKDGSYIDGFKHPFIGAYSFYKLDEDNYLFYQGGTINSASNSKLNFYNPHNFQIVKYLQTPEHVSQFLHFSDLTNFSQVPQQEVSFLYSFSDTIYQFRNKLLEPRLYIDFGDNALPFEIKNAEYRDVRDFFEYLKSTDYAFRLSGFFESPDYILMGFWHGDEFNHLLYDKLARKAIVVERIDWDLLGEGLVSNANFSFLPKGNNGDKFVFVFPTHLLAELGDEGVFSEQVAQGLGNDLGVGEDPILFIATGKSQDDD